MRANTAAPHSIAPVEPLKAKVSFSESLAIRGVSTSALTAVAAGLVGEYGMIAGRDTFHTLADLPTTPAPSVPSATGVSPESQLSQISISVWQKTEATMRIRILSPGRSYSLRDSILKGPPFLLRPAARILCTCKSEL